MDSPCHRVLPSEAPHPASCSLGCSLSTTQTVFLSSQTFGSSGVSLEHIFGEQLRSECPVLEDLKLWRCREFSGLHSDTLKKLYVYDCSGGAADKLVIRAPSLASLSLSLPIHGACGYRNGVLLYTEKFLAEAWISMGYNQLSRRGGAILLGSLFNVTSLELISFSAMV